MRERERERDRERERERERERDVIMYRRSLEKVGKFHIRLQAINM